MSAIILLRNSVAIGIVLLRTGRDPLSQPPEKDTSLAVNRETAITAKPFSPTVVLTRTNRGKNTEIFVENALCTTRDFELTMFAFTMAGACAA